MGPMTLANSGGLFDLPRPCVYGTPRCYTLPLRFIPDHEYVKSPTCAPQPCRRDGQHDALRCYCVNKRERLKEKIDPRLKGRETIMQKRRKDLLSNIHS